jgi:hypothetical protein
MTALLVTALLAIPGVTLWFGATTHYIVEPDRLLIRRAGFVWMEIPFQDVEEMEHRAIFFDRFLQIRLYQLGFRKMLRIAKRRGFRYVLINPHDPAPIIEAFYKFNALPTDRSDPSASPGPEFPFPDWLRRH